MDVIIDVEKLTKKFKHVTAVDNVSFQVQKGEIFAFLGPNGAGKSTTIKMLITLLKPTSGKAYVDSFDIVTQSKHVRNAIGYVPQVISVDSSLTAYENLMLMAKLYEIPRKQRKERIKQILYFIELEEYAKSLVRNFSGGMIRKLEIGQAMLHHPHILFLDEPTTGLDPIARQNVWFRLKEIKNSFGTTIFFSTHYMEEADEVSDRVAIMDSGKIAIIGTALELKTKTNKENATLEDAFIHFTKNQMLHQGNFREIKEIRKVIQRLG
jgi:ABC-2 type transport system ATP-binding protein